MLHRVCAVVGLVALRTPALHHDRSPASCQPVTPRKVDIVLGRHDDRGAAVPVLAPLDDFIRLLDDDVTAQRVYLMRRSFS